MYFLSSDVHAAHAVVGLLLLVWSILDRVRRTALRSAERTGIFVVAGLAVLFALDLVPYLG